jgi:hypothetical protein
MVKEYTPAAAAVTPAIVGFCTADVNPPGPIQLYVVAVTLAARFSVEPTHTGPLLVGAGVAGTGFTVTVTVKGVPEHEPAVGVTVYVSVAAAAVVLVRVWLINVCPVACALPPVTAPRGLLVGAVQV